MASCSGVGTAQFEPLCEEVADCDPSKDNSRCLCSGPSDPGYGTLEIVDDVMVPKELPKGNESPLPWSSAHHNACCRPHA